jgi:hypothetical protein
MRLSQWAAARKSAAGRSCVGRPLAGRRRCLCRRSGRQRTSSSASGSVHPAHPVPASCAAEAIVVHAGAFRDQSGYSSLRQVRGSSGWAFGVRWSRKLWYGATNGSGAITV